MNKLYKKILISIIGIFMLFVGNIFATEYSIKNLDAEIKVNEDNTLEVKENIGVNFLTRQYQIYRKLPMIIKYKDNDGTARTVNATITDINVEGSQFTTYVEGKYRVIKIGDPYTLLYGEKNYVLTYKCIIDMEDIKEKDIFYYDVLGTQCDTDIMNASFKIDFPKKIDITKIECYSEDGENKDNSNLSVELSESSIKGRIINGIGPRKNLIVKVDLEDGYFKKNIDVKKFILNNLALVTPILLLIASFVLWFMFGREVRVEEMVAFYPPDDPYSIGNPESSKKF